MLSDEAKRAVIATARNFGEGAASVQDMWTALHSNLHDLTETGALSGDYLDLFNALERWESSTEPVRDDAIESARSVARRLSESA